MNHAKTIIVGAASLFVLMLSACQAAPRGESAANTSRVFLHQFAILQRLEIRGTVDEEHTPENPFEGEPLVMRVLEADDRGARIALRVGEDRSRVWVLTTERDGRLRLRHDHRYPDGEPHDLTDYGGVAAPGGTFNRQSFPADAFTARLLPEAATNVWTMEFDWDNGMFIYDLTRHGAPRFRAVFDIDQSRLAEED